MISGNAASDMESKDPKPSESTDDVPKEEAPQNEQGDLKWSIRLEVVNRMQRRHLLVPFDRHKPDGQLKIPYFKGCRQAADVLLSAPELANSNVVKVNPSLAQMFLRRGVMAAGKTLLVPTPALEDETLLRRLEGHRINSRRKLDRAMTKRGAEELGEPLSYADFSAGLHIDVLVVGSGAVTTKGVRERISQRAR